MENFKREIFERLGNLFYALGADQRIPSVASGELKMLLRKDWLTETGTQSEDKVSEAAHLIGLTIDSLQNEKIPADKAFDEFENFFLAHREQFSHALQQRILETSEAILKTFPGKGEKNVHLENVKALFEESKQNSGIKK